MLTDYTSGQEDVVRLLVGIYTLSRSYVTTDLAWAVASRNMQPTWSTGNRRTHLKQPAPDNRSWCRMLQLQGLAVILPALQCSCWLSGLQSVVYKLDEIVETQRTVVNMLQCLRL